MSFAEVKLTLQYIDDRPFEAPCFKLIGRFTVILYDRTNPSESVNKARREYSQRNHSLENLPPIQDALLQYVLRVAYQSGIWKNYSCLRFWEWKFEDGQW